MSETWSRIRAGTPMLPPRVLASGPKPCGGNYVGGRLVLCTIPPDYHTDPVCLIYFLSNQNLWFCHMNTTRELLYVRWSSSVLWIVQYLLINYTFVTGRPYCLLSNLIPWFCEMTQQGNHIFVGGRLYCLFSNHSPWFYEMNTKDKLHIRWWSSVLSILQS